MPISSSAQPPRPEYRKTRVVCISDTHNQTPRLPQGDVLIHAGDLTNQGTFPELSKAVQWLERADFQAKIVVAGNHDITLDSEFYDQHGTHFHNQNPQDRQACLRLLRDSPTITYLNHESATLTLRSPHGSQTSFKAFGSPLSLEDGLWAFGYKKGLETKVWDDIPLDTDIVVTHGPPNSHCDTSSTGCADGCEALRRALWRARPKLAVCGHRHEGRGIDRIRWNLAPDPKYLEETCDVWVDPGQGNKKLSYVDLTARSGNPLDNYDMADATPATRNSVALPVPSTSPSRPTASNRDNTHNAASRSHWRSTPVQYGGLNDEPARSDPDPEAEGILSRLDTHATEACVQRTGRKETCVVNAAIMAKSWGGPKRFNKPIVIDIELPVSRSESLED